MSSRSAEGKTPLKENGANRASAPGEPSPVPSAAVPGASVTFKGVGKTFGKGDRRVTALTKVDLSIRAGEFVALLGPSGCGKSTLLRIVMGLEAPSEGELAVGDRVNPRPGRDRAIVFQDDSLLPWRTVAQNAELGLEFAGAPRGSRSAAIVDLLKLVGLEHFAKRYPHELSGGMRQRVNLVRALAVKPSVLLMDEPFGALDALTRETMQTELLRIWHEHASTVCFVTHSIEEAVFLADRVVVFAARPGRVLQDVKIDLPRPRAQSIRRTPEFAELARALWQVLVDSGGLRANPSA